VVVALDDAPVAHWVDLDQRLQAEPNHTFKLTWKRAVRGKTQAMSAELTQVWRKHLDDYDHTVTGLVFGAHNDVDRGTGATIPIDGRFAFATSKRSSAPARRSRRWSRGSSRSSAATRPAMRWAGR